jgi:hypothetical protein
VSITLGRLDSTTLNSAVGREADITLSVSEAIVGAVYDLIESFGSISGAELMSTQLWGERMSW